MTDLGSLRTKLTALESAASPLEPPAEQRASLARLAFDHAANFLANLPDAPANTPREQVFARRLDPEFPEDGRDPADALDYIARCVDAPGIATASPRFMGYIPGGGLFHSALADFLAATANKYAGFASAGPGAARLENATIDWLARVVGFPETALGALTSGGSIANLSAIVAARDAREAGPNSAVYSTRFAHHCVDKALHIAGLGKSPRRTIATDARHRMRLDALEAAVEADRAAGVEPWLVVA
ncbi:MAG: amino acid decarboxylase, partial [Sphingomonadaceae bacterium]|nr:amino acid decarboxylase [Sphingomonadaceae bacterium]